MMKNNNRIDHTNWREDYKQYTTSKFHLDLLENGAKSLSQSWILGALYIKWKKIKNIKDPEPPDCSSSMSEYFQKEQEFLIEDNEN